MAQCHSQIDRMTNTSPSLPLSARNRRPKQSISNPCVAKTQALVSTEEVKRSSRKLGSNHLDAAQHCCTANSRLCSMSLLQVALCVVTSASDHRPTLHHQRRDKRTKNKFECSRHFTNRRRFDRRVARVYRRMNLQHFELQPLVRHIACHALVVL